VGIDKAATTGNMMAALDGDMTKMLFVSPGQTEALSKIEGLSSYARRLISDSVAQGRVVAIPAQAVELQDRARLGWWEIDPGSGRTVGVMDDGLHQAIVNYAINLEEIGLSDKMGLMLGALVGSTSTQILLANGILEYGGVTDEMIASMEKTVIALKCMSCPQLEAKKHLKPQVGDSCYYKSYGVGGAIAPTSFCQAYFDGFSCSASMIIQGLKTGSSKPKVTAGIITDKKLICEF